MRIAFVDLEFSWPPPGGAQMDVHQTMTELRRLGHEVHLFAPATDRMWRFGSVDEDAFPLPVTQLSLGEKPFDRATAVPAFRDAVDAWRPDVVFLCFGFFLKAFLAEALSHYPIISRYYTYEMLCIRDFALHRHDTTCTKNYLDTPNVCRRCFVQFWGPGMRWDGTSAMAEEFLAAGGMDAAFHRYFADHIRSLDAIIVYNEIARERLLPYNRNVFVVPGGVRMEDFQYSPLRERVPGEKKVILLSGRADDGRKGWETLTKACDALARDRDDFEVWVTLEETADARPWARHLGWREQKDILGFYRDADICVVPSLWDEPFGMVAVEAMATGRPALVSRVGGLQHIVVDGETGFIHERKDHAQLAGHLARLLDDPALCRRMGDAGRARAEEHYAWQRVVEKHYPPIFERVLS